MKAGRDSVRLRDPECRVRPLKLKSFASCCEQSSNFLSRLTLLRVGRRPALASLSNSYDRITEHSKSYEARSMKTFILRRLLEHQGRRSRSSANDEVRQLTNCRVWGLYGKESQVPRVLIRVSI